MINQTLVIVTGLVLAAAGHVLVHNFLGAARAWVRADEQFPPVLRSSPTFAGTIMLLFGAVLVVVPVCG
jgi:hypothetical protein